MDSTRRKINLDLLRSRHSVRNYSDRKIEELIRNILNAEVTMTNSHEAGLKFQLFYDDGKPFEGFRRSYGMFKGVRNYLAAVVDPSFPDIEERSGFFAQKFVMKAVSCGLDTCFVSGTFSRENVPCQLRAGERILFLVPFGYGTENNKSLISRLAGSLMHGKKLDPADFLIGDYKDAVKQFEWLSDALVAVACAPSAMNRQPVRICYDRNIDPGALRAVIMKEGERAQLIDLGIAKYNFSVVAPEGEWRWGNGKPYLLF